MNNLSKVMQERLDKWRQNTLPVPAAQKLRGPPPTRRGGKGDYGDVETLEDLEQENKRSQRRR